MHSTTQEITRLHCEYRQHRRPSSRSAAPALRRQQSSRRQPDQDARLEPGARDPRQRRRPGLDGRRLDAAHARRQVRRPDGQAREGNAAQARGDRRRRRRDHHDPRAGEPLRHRRDHRHRRRLHRLYLMLPGVVPFPPEYAKRCREKGYWQDKSLAEEFSVCFRRFKDRVFLVDGEKQYTYGDIDRLSDNLALNLLELGLKPLDRVVPTLPNCAEFVLLYFALQKIGCIPIAALVTHRYAEISQFVRLSGATTCVYPERQGDFEFEPMIQRVKAESSTLRYCISLPQLKELIERPAALPKERLHGVHVEPTDPCIFQLSGGTTGIP